MQGHSTYASGLKTEHLSRRFGDRLAVDDVSFSVERGRLTGFVGANGAGKTTVMRMILGVLSPSAGTTTLDGVELDDATRRSFGYMPEERGLYPKMPLREQMIYFARLHGASKTQAQANSDALLEVLNLSDRAKDPIENLSLGNQQRAQVAVSLVHEPTALILDEPFSGLDPMAVDVILGVLTENAERNIPVLLSSHQLDLVERLCDDIVIIADGKVVAQGSIDELQNEFNYGRYRLIAGQDLAWVAASPGVKAIESLDTVGRQSEVVLRIDGDEQEQSVVFQTLVRKALDQGPVASFGPMTTPLSTIFREVVDGSSGQENAA